jgi:hypothetical protein
MDHYSSVKREVSTLFQLAQRSGNLKVKETNELIAAAPHLLDTRALNLIEPTFLHLIQGSKITPIM